MVNTRYITTLADCCEQIITIIIYHTSTWRKVTIAYAIDTVRDFPFLT